MEILRCISNLLLLKFKCALCKLHDHNDYCACVSVCMFCHVADCSPAQLVHVGDRGSHVAKLNYLW